MCCCVGVTRLRQPEEALDAGTVNLSGRVDNDVGLQERCVCDNCAAQGLS